MNNAYLDRCKVIDETMFGRLYIDNQFFCWTLEDVVRKEKIKHKTAIPEGNYTVSLTYSNRYKKDMPLIWNFQEPLEGGGTQGIVDNGMIFRGVRIHGGNNIKHTSGCILVGKDIDEEKKVIWGNMTDEIIDYLNKYGHFNLCIENNFEL